MESPPTFNELLDVVLREQWCTRRGCTTCGAVPFRTALQRIPRDEVLAGLRSLSAEFCYAHPDMLRLIIGETAMFPLAGDLKPILSGTAAGGVLDADIKARNQYYERERIREAFESPEATQQRRQARKAARLLATAPHRARKSESQKIIQAAAELLTSIPTEDILELVANDNLGVPARALGGLLYSRLAKHYATNSLGPREHSILSRFATDHAGHWKKLLEQLARRPCPSEG
jgi:hypothetical protein